MKKTGKKIASVLLLTAFLFSTPANTTAIAWGAMIPNVVVSVIISAVPKLFGNIWNFAMDTCEKIDNYLEVDENKEFRDPQEIMKKLEDIAQNKSQIHIYGQEKAKEQMLEALSGTVARIDNVKRKENDVREIRGNIIYVIGKPGTGKTQMCYAIADAFLRHPEKTCVFCHSESITNESELGTQLFKTISAKDIGEKRNKNIFTGSDGLIAKEEESPMLKHLLKWCESVVIIDEYEKMKLKSAKPGTMLNFGGMVLPSGIKSEATSDKSADEIFRSIASTGKYKFMNKEVDCSKTLFLITTNETREELEKNFGIGGVDGGGAQRLSVVEFDSLSAEACRGIVNDLVRNVTNILTDNEGPFKLKNVIFDEKSLESMSKYIFDDDVMQGRAKNKLEDKIYSLFAKSMGKETGKEVKIEFIPQDEKESGYFIKEILES